MILKYTTHLFLKPKCAGQFIKKPLEMTTIYFTFKQTVFLIYFNVKSVSQAKNLNIKMFVWSIQFLKTCNILV